MPDPFRQDDLESPAAEDAMIRYLDALKDLPAARTDAEHRGLMMALTVTFCLGAAALDVDEDAAFSQLADHLDPLIDEALETTH